MNKQKFDQLHSEYRICFDHANKLETNIWTTAGIFGIGSAVGFIAVAARSDLASSNYSLAAVLAAFFSIIISMVWLRFVKRWRSVQSLQFERMDELEKQMGYKRNTVINTMDEKAMLYRKRSPWYRTIFHYIPRSIRGIDKKEFDIIQNNKTAEQKLFQYEFRENIHVCELLVITNILVWLTFMAVVSHQYLLGDLVFLIPFAVVVIYFWRKT